MTRSLSTNARLFWVFKTFSFGCCVLREFNIMAATRRCIRNVPRSSQSSTKEGSIAKDTSVVCRNDLDPRHALLLTATASRSILCW
ncbi:unnamed protein product [Pylaiella littoralis]